MFMVDRFWNNDSYSRFSHVFHVLTIVLVMYAICTVAFVALCAWGVFVRLGYRAREMIASVYYKKSALTNMDSGK